MIRIEDIMEKASEYLHPDDKNLTEEDMFRIQQAFIFAAMAHAGQFRRSGEPYLSHPLEVAYILTDLTVDAVGVCAGLLHDVVEDTPYTIEDITEKFGSEIAAIVSGLTKLNQLDFDNKNEAKAANIAKLVRSGTFDDRVFTVKLADRLHNMRTLSAQKPEKQKEIARETETIFVPLAMTMGLHGLKHELGELCLRYLKPEVYDQIHQGMEKQREQCLAYIKRVTGELNALLSKNGIKGRATGRIKHLYGLYHKIRERRLKLDQMQDLVGFRVIVWDVRDCQTVMWRIHEQFPPVHGRMTDYISSPKIHNDYQSLHTSVIGPEVRRIEIQIRTEAMHEVAERGITAHHYYKGNRAERLKRRTWLQEIAARQAESQDSEEVLASFADMGRPEIIVFTPKRRPLTLPSGATVVDFAYAVNKGNQCAAAWINGQPAALDTPLQEGDQVNILADPNAHPQIEWLDFVQTEKAKVRIEKWLRKDEKGKNACEKLGQNLLNSAIGAQLEASKLEALARSCGCASAKDLFFDMGYERIIPIQVRQWAVQINAQTNPAVPTCGKEAGPDDEAVAVPPLHQVEMITVYGHKNPLIGFMNCCSPIPDDEITACGRKGRGVEIHLAICPVAQTWATDRRYQASWCRGNQNQPFSAMLHIVCRNHKGVLAAIAATLAEENVNIEEGHFQPVDRKTSDMTFIISVRDTLHLNGVIDKINTLESVSIVHRTKLQNLPSSFTR